MIKWVMQRTPEGATYLQAVTLILLLGIMLYLCSEMFADVVNICKGVKDGADN